MKKSLLALTAALSFGLAAAQTAAPVSAPQVPALTDVPAGHWAKDAIDRLVSRGIILGYPDGTFRGTQNLTRYEAAIIIARLLDEIRSGDVPVAPAPGGLTQDDLTAVQNAIQELAADLAALGVRVSDLEENAVSRDDFSRLEARIEEVAAAGNTGEAEAVATLRTQLEELTGRVDEYDTLRADVDDNASSIAALNDLTVLLNQDILDLQDRVSAVEAAQADFVQRSDFDNLAGRVTTVETRVETVNNSLTGRIAALERNAFSLKPSLTLGYSVSRTNRNFDIDRLFPLNADGTVANNAFTSGGIDADTGAQRRDFGDFGDSSDRVVAGAAGLYGFAATAGTPRYQEGSTDIGISLGFDTSGQFNQVTSTSSGTLFSTAGRLTVNQIDLNFGLVTGLPGDAYVDTNGNGKRDTETYTDTNANGRYDVGEPFVDANGNGAYDNEPENGRATYPGSGGTVGLRDDAGNLYRPVFFRFKNATTQFSVGNNPVIVTLGQQQKFYFADYAFDNDKDGRGDGYTVLVDGSNVPVIGAWKPQIYGVYGSRSGDDNIGEAGYGVYYRGVRAQITPVGTLTAGLFYAQEGRDQFGAAAAAGQTPAVQAAAPSDVTLFGADLHGKAFGVELHSEYVTSRVTPVGSTTATTANAFYIRSATRNANKTYNLSTPSAKFGTDVFNVALYDLNYRQIGAGMTAASAISEFGYDTRPEVSSTRQNNADNPDKGVTAPFSNLRGRTTAGSTTNDGLIGQKGFGVKAAVTLGPVAIGGYYDSSTGANGSFAANDPNLMVERGASAKVAYSIFSLRGSYNELQSNRFQTYRLANDNAGNTLGASVTQSATVRRYAVQADVTPGRGLFAGVYYRDVSVNGVRSTTDRGLLGRGYLASSFAPGVGNNTYRAGLSCVDQNFGTSVSVNGVSGDTDGVGGVLNPAVNLDANRSTTCFTSYGVEVGHAGDAENALVKDLFFRVGYGRVYVPATATATTGEFSGSVAYGDVRYDRKVGVANVRLAGSVSNTNVRLDTRPAGTRGAVGLIVRTDPLENLPFRPQLNGQVGYYTSQFDDDFNPTTASLNANALKYGAGIVLNDFLLPETRIGVRYDGYTGINRAYTPFAGDETQGFFSDANTNGTRVNLNGVYVEGAYRDLVFSYGSYTLSGRNAAGTEIGSGVNNGQPARGQTFKIAYRVNF